MDTIPRCYMTAPLHIRFEGGPEFDGYLVPAMQVRVLPALSGASGSMEELRENTVGQQPCPPLA